MPSSSVTVAAEVPATILVSGTLQALNIALSLLTLSIPRLELAAKIARSFMRPSGLFAKAVSQQLGDLLETLKGQPGLSQVEGERAPQYRGEARSQNAGYSFIRVDIEDELEGL